MKTADQIKSDVRQQYAGIVANPKEKTTGCCSSDCCTPEKDLSFAGDYTTLEGYVPDADFNLGCGIPTEYAQIKVGDTVLDLGSGAGNDAFIARSIVGHSGKIIGVDMTPEMVFKARENKAKMGYENVDFRLGEIENLPVESNSIDVVVSNCVLNLVPDKDRAFSETYRVLKHGGHFSISDIVVEDATIPEILKNDIAAYAGCISGAIDKKDYLHKVRSAGFKNIQIQKERPLDIPEALLAPHADEIGRSGLPKLVSITVYGEKPEA